MDNKDIRKILKFNRTFRVDRVNDRTNDRVNDRVRANVDFESRNKDQT